MDYDIPIAELTVGQDLEGYYLLRDAVLKTTSNGKPFLNGELQDRSGSVSFISWDYEGPLTSADNGKVVKIRGRVKEFKDALQVSVAKIRLSEPRDNFDLGNLVPVAPIDMDVALQDVSDMLHSIRDEEYKQVCLTIFERHEGSFRTIPAAKSVHHSFLGGLLMHTWDMMRAADYLSELYHEVIDRDLMLAGTFLHDLSKRDEFSFSEIGLVTDYSIKGQLLGHIVMGAEEVAEVCKKLKIDEEKSILLQHMVLSHHGQPEFGAAVRPMIAEAELLSLIDAMDSRMEIYAEAYEDIREGQFSQRIFALERKVYRHALPRQD